MEPAHSLRGPGGTPQLDFSGYYASSTLADCTITITTVETDEEPSAPAAKRAKAVAGGNAGATACVLVCRRGRIVDAAGPSLAPGEHSFATAIAPMPLVSVSTLRPPPPTPPAPPRRAAAAVDVLPGHAIVLSTSSSWMRRQIEASAASAGGPAAHAPDVTLRVRPGQEPAARRLVRFIYEGAASMPSAGAAAAGGASGQATQALLVDMLALSHTYRVPTCAGRAAAGRVEAGTMAWIVLRGPLSKRAVHAATAQPAAPPLLVRRAGAALCASRACWRCRSHSWLGRPCRRCGARAVHSFVEPPRPCNSAAALKSQTLR